jgi:hypothetical protein
MEVLIALAIFLLSMGALTQLTTLSNRMALEGRYRSEATRIAESRLAEVISGVVSISGQGDTPDDDDPEYTCSITSDAGSVAGTTVTGLYLVTVSVQHALPDGSKLKVDIQQYVFDPAMRGSTQDTVTIAGTPQQASSGNSSSSNQSSSSTPAAAGAAPAKSTTGAKSATGSSMSGGASTPSKATTPAPAPAKSSSTPAAGRSSGGKS